ncbi:unnamed protein product [Heligmosomoides polygyrus]|uniref:Uncharacterized protein n=1 Tax=Heligmosomoides polygyrus TaxID=6339 RepID=A0A3P7X8X1_HELPZ|nr:unnamed protein product [Heligmosomoides polygyrus]
MVWLQPMCNIRQFTGTVSFTNAFVNHRSDKFTCGGNQQPTGGCHELSEGCPSGSTCIKGGLGVGLCCENSIRGIPEAWEEETNPKCTVGDVLMRATWYGSTVWLGKSCSHRFCPFTYDCVQGKRVAYCCANLYVLEKFNDLPET